MNEKRHSRVCAVLRALQIALHALQRRFDAPHEPLMHRLLFLAPPSTVAEQRAPPHVTLPDHFSY
ncbi:MAG: hypothetical protein NTW87_36470 [Planctomycetota bacterium]|nr:hypothetical protein [Planctomycetota bacterium]